MDMFSQILYDKTVDVGKIFIVIEILDEYS
jgi:hypothetical protein